MTERTIRALAVEYAARKYEEICSTPDHLRYRIRWPNGTVQNIDPKAFRTTYPTLRDYLAGTRRGTLVHKPDGSVFVKEDGRVTPHTPGWMHYVKQAREDLTAMLGMPHVSEVMKERIFAAIQEDRQKQFELDEKKLKSLAIPQRKIIQ